LGDAELSQPLVIEESLLWTEASPQFNRNTLYLQKGGIAMGRTWQEMVADFPEFRRNQVYRARIRRLTKSPKPKGMCVLLEYLDNDQGGRTHEVFLPLPIRPAGLTASLFNAAGVDLAVGKTVNPKAAVGAIVGVRGAPTETGEWTVAGFEKLGKEDGNESDS
jgi:hypothetical protein